MEKWLDRTQILATGWWCSTVLQFPLDTNKTHSHDKTEILLKVTLNTIIHN